MADDGGVGAALASAKKTLSNVSHSNVDTGGSHAWTKPSYSAARSASSTPKPAAPKTGLAAEAEDAGKGIKSRMEMTEAARKSIAQ